MKEIEVDGELYISVRGGCTGCVFAENRGECSSIYEENDGCKDFTLEGDQNICWIKKECTANGVEESEEEFDIVSKPKHYMLVPGIEVRDICKALAERMQDKYPAFFISDYIQFLQYVLRFDQKNGIEDLKKARWYLEKLIDKKNS